MAWQVVTSRKGRVSRNTITLLPDDNGEVTSRKGRVSRNKVYVVFAEELIVTSRKGRVSRNSFMICVSSWYASHVP